jgi:hypothetical protein
MPMRKLLVLFAMGLTALPLFAGRKVTVEQLRQTLVGVHGQSDKKIAKQIADLELTERLSRAEFDEISKTLPGPRSRTVLLGITDASAFLDPPPSERIADPAPDEVAQRQMLVKAAQFAVEESEQLPALQGIRSTNHFQDVRVYPYSNKIEYYTPGSFRLLEHQFDDVAVAPGGDELLDQADKDLDQRMAKKPQPLMYMTIFGYQTIWGNITWGLPNLTQAGMKATGAFGPWLQAVTGDVPDAHAEWAYWERAGSGKLAVFRFQIPQESSHYTIEYYFAPNPLLSREGRQYTAEPEYHGEIAIDPASGQVVRIVVICDFAKGEPMSKASFALTYGPVEIGGETYVLPIRGVSITGFMIATHNFLFDTGEYIGDQIDHFPITSLDDFAYTDYSAYKPRVRIVPLKSLDRPAN